MFAVGKLLRHRVILCHLRLKRHLVLGQSLPGIRHGCPENVCLRLIQFRPVIYLDINGICRKLRARDLEGDALRTHVPVYSRKGHGRRTRRAVRARVVDGVVPSPDQTFPSCLSVLPCFHKEHLVCILLRRSIYRARRRHFIIFLLRGVMVSGRQLYLSPRIRK